MAGKVAATFQIRVTLREQEGLSIEQWRANAEAGGVTVGDPVPTIAQVEGIVAFAIYDQLPYFHADEINVSAERMDRD